MITSLGLKDNDFLDVLNVLLFKCMSKDITTPQRLVVSYKCVYNIQVETSTHGLKPHHYAAATLGTQEIPFRRSLTCGQKVAATS